MFTDAEVEEYAKNRKDGRADCYNFNKETYKDYPRSTVPYKRYLRLFTLWYYCVTMLVQGGTL